MQIIYGDWALKGKNQWDQALSLRSSCPEGGCDRGNDVKGGWQKARVSETAALRLTGVLKTVGYSWGHCYLPGLCGQWAYLKLGLAKAKRSLCCLALSSPLGRWTGHRARCLIQSGSDMDSPSPLSHLPEFLDLTSVFSLACYLLDTACTWPCLGKSCGVKPNCTETLQAREAVPTPNSSLNLQKEQLASHCRQRAVCHHPPLVRGLGIRR